MIDTNKTSAKGLRERIVPNVSPKNANSKTTSESTHTLLNYADNISSIQTLLDEMQQSFNSQEQPLIIS